MDVIFSCGNTKKSGKLMASIITSIKLKKAYLFADILRAFIQKLTLHIPKPNFTLPEFQVTYHLSQIFFVDFRGKYERRKKSIYIARIEIL